MCPEARAKDKKRFLGASAFKTLPFHCVDAARELKKGFVRVCVWLCVYVGVCLYVCACVDSERRSK